MSVLYRPVLIESVEQADALPVGTIIECTGGALLGVAPHRKVGPGEWFGGSGRTPTEYLRVDASGSIRSEWTALVPIEAEQLTITTLSGGTTTRYITPWEEA